jgi:hypothetical protein
MASESRLKFEAAAKQKDWKAAYFNFRLLGMDELVRSLHGLGAASREAFWGHRMTYQAGPTELARWEYAFTVAHYLVLPNELWDPQAIEQEAQAQKFLSEVAKKTKRKQTRLEQNLGYSMQAVNYVLTTNQVKGANWDQYRRQPNSEQGTKKPDALDICLYDRVRPQARLEIKRIERRQSLTNLDRMRIKAEHAKEGGCGNCGENSMLAFIFLWDMAVRPLDWMEVDKDHQFVVIGRLDGLSYEWAKWGPDAVICDPWGQGLERGDISIGTYPATQFESKMTAMVGKSFSVYSQHRED